jgi:TatD DNase family protein
MLIDTHCHLDFPEYDADRDQVIDRAREKGVTQMITIGATVERSVRSVELARRYDCIYAAVGCHPHDAQEFTPEGMQTLRELSRDKRTVAIGEIGLDYYRNLSPADVQKKVFVELIGLAREADLPVVLHTRQAAEDTLDILKAEQVSKGVVHCFSGDEAFLNACLDLGLYISFTCTITYKKAADLRHIVELVPLDRMCLETDAPYLSPEGFRGKRNEPAFVRLLAEEVARIKNVPFERVCRSTTDAALALFHAKPRLCCG